MSDKPQKPVFTEVQQQTRTYKFPDMDMVVEDVISIHVSKRGTHRLNTKSGRKFIIPTGWRGIEFDAADWTF